MQRRPACQRQRRPVGRRQRRQQQQQPVHPTGHPALAAPQAVRRGASPMMRSSLTPPRRSTWYACAFSSETRWPPVSATRQDSVATGTAQLLAPGKAAGTAAHVRHIGLVAVVAVASGAGDEHRPQVACRAGGRGVGCGCRRRRERGGAGGTRGWPGAALPAVPWPCIGDACDAAGGRGAAGEPKRVRAELRSAAHPLPASAGGRRPTAALPGRPGGRELAWRQRVARECRGAAAGRARQDLGALLQHRGAMHNAGGWCRSR